MRKFLLIWITTLLLFFPGHALGQLPAPVNLMAWVSGSHVTVVWDPVPEASGYFMHGGFETGAYVVSIDVGISTTFSASNVAEGTYYIAVSAYDAAGIEGDRSEVEVIVPGDGSEAGEGGENTGQWDASIQFTEINGECGDLSALGGDPRSMPVYIDQRGQSLHVALGGFNFRGALRHDGSFLMAGAQPWQAGSCHHTFRYYLAGTLVDDVLTGAGEFFDTWFCRVPNDGQEDIEEEEEEGGGSLRVQPENPGNGRPDNPGNGRPDNPGNGRPDHAGNGHPETAGNGVHGNNGHGNGNSQVNRCSMSFEITGTRLAPEAPEPEPTGN